MITNYVKFLGRALFFQSLSQIWIFHKDEVILITHNISCDNKTRHKWNRVSNYILVIMANVFYGTMRNYWISMVIQNSGTAAHNLYRTFKQLKKFFGDRGVCNYKCICSMDEGLNQWNGCIWFSYNHEI